MGNANPYFDPSEDDDILNDSVETTPEIKQEFTKQQKMYGPDGKELPANVQQQLGKYLQVGSIDQRSANTPIEFRAMSSLMEFYASLTSFRFDGPLIAAMAHVLDQITDGQVTTMHRKYEAERKLLYSRVITTFGAILLRIYQETEGLAWQEELIHYCVSLNDINDYVRRKAEFHYRQVCEELGDEPDENLIEYGRYSGISNLHKIAFGNPPTMDAMKMDE